MHCGLQAMHMIFGHKQQQEGFHFLLQLLGQGALWYPSVATQGTAEGLDLRSCSRAESVYSVQGFARGADEGPEVPENKELHQGPHNAQRHSSWRVSYRLQQKYTSQQHASAAEPPTHAHTHVAIGCGTEEHQLALAAEPDTHLHISDLLSRTTPRFFKAFSNNRCLCFMPATCLRRRPFALALLSVERRSPAPAVA